jgi:5'-nucleotidase
MPEGSPIEQAVISNDDGIDAPGLSSLLDALGDLVRCVVVAPDSAQSGVGHAVSDGAPIRVERRDEQHFAVAGTPADCARLALTSTGVLPDAWHAARKDRALWLIAGINHGANLGVDTYISGTVAAAREAAIHGFPALAISQYVGRHRSVDWERTAARARPVIRALLARPPAPGSFWNVNLPQPGDETIHCEVVHCPPDPSPHPVRYQRVSGHFEYIGDYHNRPRRAEHDVDVCFGGRIAVSEIRLAGLPLD